jgi:hypothetical protein
VEWKLFRFYKKNILWGIYHLKVGTQLNLHTLNLLHLFFIFQWSNIQIEGIRFYIDVNNKTDDWHVSDNSMVYNPFWETHQFLLFRLLILSFTWWWLFQVLCTRNWIFTFLCINEIKNKKYHNFGTVLKYNWKLVM